jgi:hypothetical protein
MQEKKSSDRIISIQQKPEEPKKDNQDKKPES